MKALLAVLTLALCAHAHAAPTLVETLVQRQQELFVDQASMKGLDWKVGDQADYSIDMGFIKGTMIMKVKSFDAEGIWIDQDMDLGFAGKTLVQTLLDPNTGEIKKLIVNGKEEPPPKSDTEIIDITEDRITVPAGTFDCIHARLKDNGNGGKEINVWINPQVVPMSGMLKTVQPTQLGQATILLKSFRKN